MKFKIVGKYIKDLKFSIPNSKVCLMLAKNIANYKINIDIKSNQVDKNILEIFTTLNLIPITDNFEKIDTKIVYATIIELIDKQIQKKDMEKIILIDVPTEIYAELRGIFVSLFERSGFKDIKISENVDFQKLYNMKKVQ
tara:strand:+ start:205 stop:624 length:420 start_codon:yes stop_codon:yes gene_type:complete